MFYFDYENEGSYAIKEYSLDTKITRYWDNNFNFEKDTLLFSYVSALDFYVIVEFNQVRKIAKEMNSCYGILSSDPSVCNGRGSCVETDTCQCFSDSKVKISGLSCEQLLCKSIYNGVEYFLDSNDPRVCSKNGKCTFNSTNPEGCSCKSGFFGESCEKFGCFSIPKNDANVCSGKGKCVDMDTCQCLDDSNGHYYGPSCSSCHPGYSGIHCTEKACAASTCLNGVCGGDNQCTCSGNFTGIICDNCIIDHYGSDCKVLCNEKTTCLGHGACDSTGTCVCYADREQGYWNGPNCDSCLKGYFGSECSTYFSSFNSSSTSNIIGQISKYFDGILFKLFGPSSYSMNSVMCSLLIHSHDLALLGSEPKCYWTDKETGNFKIEFDNDFIFDISQTKSIRLNTNVFSKSKVADFIGLSLILSEEMQLPISVIQTTKKLYSTSENVHISGANSFSGDKKGLEYYWDVSGNITSNLFQFIRLIRDPILKIDKGKLTSGFYTINLIVKSQVSKLVSSQSSENIEIQNVEFPSVVISGKKELVMLSTEKSVIIKKTTSLPTSLKDKEMKVEWQLVAGPAIKFEKDSYNNLLIPQFSTGKRVYSFKVSIYSVENPSLTSSDTVIINTEQPSLTLSLILTKNSNASQSCLQINFQDPENNTDEIEVWSWTCIDSETFGYCGDFIVEKMYQYGKDRSSIVVVAKEEFSNQLINPTFTLTITKGKRFVSSSITLKISHPPPIVNVIDISPKLKTKINDNDKISIEIKHPDQDPADSTLSVKTQWKIDGTIVSECETSKVSNEIQTICSTISSPYSNIKIVNKNQQSSIIVDSKELEYGMKHSIQLKVSFVNKNHDEIAATEVFNNFLKSQPPKKCPCKISPSTGISMKTDFSFSCDNCQNEDNTIEIKQGYIDRETGIKVSVPLSQDSTMKIPSIPSSLNDETVTLFIELIDTNTGESRLMKSNVTVRPDTVSSLSEIMEQVSNQTNLISAFVKDGDTSRSVSQTINTVISTTQLLQSLPSTSKDSSIISSIQSKLLDTLASSVQTDGKDSAPESSAITILAVNAMIKSENIMETPVIRKSITVLNNVIQLTIKSKVDIFSQSFKPLMNTIGTLSTQVSKMKLLRDQFEHYESIAIIAKDYVLSFVQVQSVSVDPAALQQEVANVKADKVYLTDFSSSIVTSPPTKERVISYQAYVKIPSIEFTEINEYAELTYCIVMKDHVSTIFTQIIEQDLNISSLIVVSPQSVSFSLSSPKLLTTDLPDKIAVNVHINDEEFISSVDSLYSCIIIQPDLEYDTSTCTVFGRDSATNSITCNCNFESWKIENLIVVKDLKKYRSPPKSSKLQNNSSIIIILSVVIPSGSLIIILAGVVALLCCVYCVKKRKPKINPYNESNGLHSHNIKQPSKIMDSSLISIHQSDSSMSLL